MGNSSLKPCHSQAIVGISIQALAGHSVASEHARAIWIMGRSCAKAVHSPVGGLTKLQC